jgi:hypothetical protein
MLPPTMRKESANGACEALVAIERAPAAAIQGNSPHEFNQLRLGLRRRPGDFGSV